VWKYFFHSVEKIIKHFPLRGKVTPKVFHCVEKSIKLFPLCGKIAQSFSIAWKNRGGFFHGVEKWAALFPRCGKSFSIVWWHRQKPGIRFVPFFMRQGVWALALGVVAGDEEVL